MNSSANKSTYAIKLPDVGEGVTEAELVEWHVELGDFVKEDDVIAAIMTDKATVEIPSLYNGVIVWRGGEVGENIPVGADLIRIESLDTKTGETSDVTNQPSTEVDKTAKEPEITSKAEIPQTSPNALAPAPIPQLNQNVTAPRPEGEKPLAAPAVRARARSAGIDLRQVRGTGPAGRITHDDLDAVFSASKVAPKAAALTANTSQKETKIVGLRRKIAEKMSLANTRIPHITVVEEIDVTTLEDLRAKLNIDKGEKPKLTILPFVIAALNKAVAAHPEMNARFDDDDGVLTEFGGVHAGVATMTDKGLVVPVIKHTESLSVWDIASEIKRLSDTARAGTIKREELSGSTITVTSLGPLGALVTTPIINHPEVAIVGVNKMAIRSHWDGTQFVPRKMMNISCSFDHRIIDGWDAAVFVQKMKTLLETPALMFMEG